MSNKRCLLFLVAAFSMPLASCTPSSSSDSSGSSEITFSDLSSSSVAEDYKKNLPFQAGSDLIFTEFYSSNKTDDRAFEVSNIGEGSIDLSEYLVVIYRGGYFLEPYLITLNGTLSPNEAFVVAYQGCSLGMREKADLLDPLLPNIGYYPMALVKDGYRVDTLGIPGYKTHWCQEEDLVRKNEFKEARDKFEPYDWAGFASDDYDRLGESTCPLSKERIDKGPLLTSTDFTLGFAGSDEVGKGGAEKVSLRYVIDGDTAKFNYPSSMKAIGITDGTNVRFQNIDTPEIDHGSGAMPYGEEAKVFCSSKMNQAGVIALQSVKGGQIRETYNRLLAFVWIAPSNPNPEDYRNMSHIMIFNGYSDIQFGTDLTDKMISDGISYLGYLRDAENHAKKEKLNLHSES